MGSCVNYPRMIELEAYAVGLRDDDNVLKLDHQLEALPGIRYQADPNHDIVYFELDEPSVTLSQILDAFARVGLKARFVGEVPSELEVGTRTQRIE